MWGLAIKKSLPTSLDVWVEGWLAMLLLELMWKQSPNTMDTAISLLVSSGSGWAICLVLAAMYVSVLESMLSKASLW